ncbi:hypothetical protein SAMN05421790_109106 [Kroppenstedtia eburnea]|uniref:Uncharacterized protein n=1 Tax=Kroppenstedtia eburnea TaxID=714067 RepID=A0A1N7NMB9_9BACL|nr:hypothetical protein SAMN05421790_109106 [Kroppenstedtia eburnea]
MDDLYFWKKYDKITVGTPLHNRGGNLRWQKNGKVQSPSKETL